MTIYDKLLQDNKVDHSNAMVLLAYASKNPKALKKTTINNWLKQIDWNTLDIYEIHDTIMRVCVLCKTMKYEDGQIKSPFTDIYNVARSPTPNRFEVLLNNKAFQNSHTNFKLGVLSILNTIDDFWSKISNEPGIEYDPNQLADILKLPNFNMSFFTSIYEGPQVFESLRLAGLDVCSKDEAYELPDSLIQLR